MEYRSIIIPKTPFRNILRKSGGAKGMEMMETSADRRAITPGRILDQLRIDIILGKYSPGTKLVEADIAGQFGAARGSVRSALQSLRNEGLVEFHPNGRKSVIGFSYKYALDMYELRWMMENRAVEIAMQNRRSFHTPMIAVLDRIEQCGADREQEIDWFALDIQFHRALVQIADNKPLLNAWEINTPLMYALMKLNTREGYREAYIGEFRDKHKAIFDLVITRNPVCFEKLREHIIDAETITSSLLK